MRSVILAELDGVHLKTVAGDIRLLDSEPSSCKVLVSNHARDYGPYSSSAAIRQAEPKILKFRKISRVGSQLRSWVSPEFIVEDYQVGPGATAEFSGRCRLAELDSDDRTVDVGGGVSTAERMDLDELAALIAAEGGLTITGLQGRLVRQYHVVGNLLSLLSDLLYPLEHFRMGPGSQIVCSRNPIGSHTYTDQDDLKSCVFRRSRYVQNQAVVERLESGGGVIVLASDEREGNVAGVSDLIPLSEPSRSWWAEWECARGKMLWSAYDESGNPLNPPLSPLGGSRYQGSTLSTHARFSYDLAPGANDNGDDWKQRYKYTIYGWPAGAIEPPVEGYSATGNAGTGPRRRFPQPFSLPSIDTHGDAQAASDAIAEEGNSQGSSLAIELAMAADVPLPFSEVTVTDYVTGVDQMTGLVRASVILWDERPRGQNRISVEATVSE